MIGLPPVQPEEYIEKVVLRDAYGSVNFYLLPFVKPSMVKLITGTDEKGNNLSGGQRQRLTIARAIVKNAPILLLDEPTSALDLETEKNICNTFDEVSRNHTVIAVAHRLNTIKNYDRIYVLNHGRIVEQGTHEELLSQQGEYCQMYQDYVRKEM